MRLLLCLALGRGAWTLRANLGGVTTSTSVFPPAGELRGTHHHLFSPHPQGRVGMCSYEALPAAWVMSQSRSSATTVWTQPQATLTQASVSLSQ